MGNEPIKRAWTNIERAAEREGLEELRDAFDEMHRVTEGGCDTRGADVADLVFSLGFRRPVSPESTKRVDFGSPKPHCSCLSSFDGEGDGRCAVHKPEPQGEPTDAPTVQLMARRGGKTQALIESMLAQANERGIRVEVIHTQTEPTDAAVKAALDAWYASGHYRAEEGMRAALRAAVETTNENGVKP